MADDPLLIQELKLEIEKVNNASEHFARRASKLDHATLTRLCYQYFSRVYDQHMEETGHFRALRQALEPCKQYIQGPSLTSKDRRRSLLDISCGTGEALFLLADHLQENDIDVTANDFSPDMVTIAQQKLRQLNNLQFLEKDITQGPCPFSLERYDTILCSYSIHSFREKPIIPLIQAVANGGFLIFIEEWPCLVTSSKYMPASVAQLLTLSERPVEVIQGSGPLENMIIREGSFATMHLESGGDSLGRMMAFWNYMSPVAAGCYRIDGRHQLYVHVYEKNMNPGII